MSASRPASMDSSSRFDPSPRCTRSSGVRESRWIGAVLTSPGAAVSVDDLAKRFWGDVYYNEERRSFVKKAENSGHQRTFVHFILEPLYKIFGQVIGEDKGELKETLAQLGITLKSSVYDMNMKPLLKVVFIKFFTNCSAFVDMITRNLPDPKKSAMHKVIECPCDSVSLSR